MIAHFAVGLSAVPQGSVRPGVNRGRPVVRQGASDDHAARLAVFRAAVADAARRWKTAHGWPDNGPWPHHDDPLVYGAVYWARRATTDRRADWWHAKKQPGDLSKLDRAVEDALTGVMYRDDAQIAFGVSAKVICPPGQEARCDIWVAPAAAGGVTAVTAAVLEATKPTGKPRPISSAGLANAGHADRIGSVKPSESSILPACLSSCFRVLTDAGPLVGRG